MKVRNLTIPQRDFILSMSGVVTAILFFVSGVGSYRIFLVFAFEESLKGSKILQNTVVIGVLAYIVSGYLDFTKGPIIFPETKNYFIVVLLSFIVVRLMIQKSFKRLISDITQNQYFETCPSCHYHNSYLVGSCANCDYKKGDALPSSARISPEVKGDKIPSGLTNLLVLSEDDEIIFHKKLAMSTRKIKNGNRVVRKHLVITSKSMILLDYKLLHFQIPINWTERDVIPISSVIAVEGNMNERYMAESPALKIRTNQDDVYEIVFTSFGNAISDIKEIAAIVKGVNPKVDISIMLSQTLSLPTYGLLSSLRLNDPSDTDRDKRMLILLPLVLILLGLVLWQVFHSGIN